MIQEWGFAISSISEPYTDTWACDIALTRDTYANLQLFLPTHVMECLGAVRIKEMPVRPVTLIRALERAT